jgi:hypothetical protein
METNPIHEDPPQMEYQTAAAVSAVQTSLPAKTGVRKAIAWAIFLGGLFAALQGLAILILSAEYHVNSNAIAMMFVKWILAAFFFIIARDVFQAVDGFSRKRTRIMASVIGAILLLVLIFKYWEMLRQVGALNNASISFLLKIPDYGFAVIFPFTVLACLAVPFVLKKRTAE